MLKIAGSKLVAMLDVVGWAMSCDEDRPHLACVQVEVVKDRLRLVATNGHVLAVATNGPPVTDGETHAPPTRLAMDRRDANRIRYLASRATKPLSISMVMREVTKDATLPAGTLCIDDRKFESLPGNQWLPPWRQVVPAPTQSATRIVVDAAPMLETLHSFKCACNTRTNQIRLDVKGHELQFTAENEQGDAFDAFNAEKVSGKDCRIGVDRGYLHDAITAIVNDCHTDATRRVALDIRDELDPIVVRPDVAGYDCDRIVVVMPVRL